MLLKRLSEYADRLPDRAPFGYEDKQIRYVIELDMHGRVRNVVDQAQGPKSKDKEGKGVPVPHVGRTSRAVRPRLLADNGEYILGKLRPKTTQGGTDKAYHAFVEAAHRAFVDLVHLCAIDTREPTVVAIREFLDAGADLEGYLRADFDAGAIMTFEVDEVLPIELPTVQDFWERRLSGSESKADESESAKGSGELVDGAMQCLVCGNMRPPMKRLANKWKGIPGGNSAGVSIISADSDAFMSYGLENSLIAPTCAACGDRFSKAANMLLADDQSRLWLRSLVYIFWTRNPVPDFNVVEFFDYPKPDTVRTLLESPHTGQRGALRIEDTPFYAAAFSGSGARVVVRDWIDTTVGKAKDRLRRYFLLQEIVGRDGLAAPPLKMMALAGATVRDLKDLPSQTPKTLLTVALHGGILPQHLLSQVVQRCRAGRDVSRPQAALIKMVLLSQQVADEQVGREAAMVELDKENREPAYLCGRLLAVLEEAQWAAMGRVNATIIDRYMGTASSAPASVFGRLLTGSQAHLSTLRRDWPAKEQSLQKRLEEVQAGLRVFPKTLTLPQQGLFMLGYYHQRAADRAERASRRRDTVNGAEPQDTVAVASDDE